MTAPEPAPAPAPAPNPNPKRFKSKDGQESEHCPNCGCLQFAPFYVDKKTTVEKCVKCGYTDSESKKVSE